MPRRPDNCTLYERLESKADIVYFLQFPNAPPLKLNFATTAALNLTLTK